MNVWQCKKGNKIYPMKIIELGARNKISILNKVINLLELSFFDMYIVLEYYTEGTLKNRKGVITF